MAFNPFHRFRKNQKVWMAALVIMSMFSFIAIGSLPGMGDFLSFVTEMFGAEGRSPRAGTVYGQTIHAADLDRLQRQRLLAHWFMSIAVGEATARITAHIAEDVRKWDDKAAAAQVERVLNARQEAMDPAYAQRLALQFPQYAELAQQLAQQARQQYIQNIGRFDQDLQMIEANLGHSNKKEQAQHVAILRNVLLEDFRALQTKGQLYFGGSMRMTPQEAFDFLIWRRQADQLGIALVWKDVFQMLQRRTLGAFPTENEWPTDIDAVVARQVGPFSAQELHDALRDEFRVQLAKQALLGPAGMDLAMRRVPATPYQAWQHYEQQRTENQVAMLPVPANDPDFIRKVKQPTKKELEDFFNKHRNLDYDPASPTPGFKQPPRLKIGWLGLSADAPAIRKEAEETVHRQEAAMKAAALVLAAARGATAGNPAGAGLAFTGAALNEPVNDDVQRKYSDYALYEYKYSPWSRLPSWTLPGYVPALYTSMNRHASVAATVGQILGGAGTQAPALAAAVSHPAMVYARDSKGIRPKLHDQIVRNAFVDNPAPWLALANPSPLATAALWIHAADQTQPLSYDMLKDRLMEGVYDAQAKKLVNEKIEKLQDELNASSDVKTWAQARQYQRLTVAKERQKAIELAVGAIGTGHMPLAPLTVHSFAEWDKQVAGDNLLLARTMLAAGPSPLGVLAAKVAEDAQVEVARRAPVERAIASGLYQHGQSARANDRFEVSDDRGLRPLRRAAELERPDQKFWELCFNRTGQPTTPVYDLYKPGMLTLTDAGRSYLYWSTEEKPSYVPTFAEAEKRVKERWLLENARKYAKEEADKLAAEVGKAGGDGRRMLVDEALKHPTWGHVIELNNIAPLVEEKVAQPSRFETPFMPYTEQRLQGVVDYPSPEMVQDLLKLRKPDETVVMHDRPETTYYVAVLEKRVPPDELAFYKAYSAENERSELMARLEQESQYVRNLRAGVMQELRDEAGYHIEQSYLDRWAEQQRKNQQ
jgi:hypothetical protein